VTAFVRSSTTLPSSARRLTIVRGDVRDADAVGAAVEGQDAVVCALGAATPLRRDTALAEGMPNIVAATKRHGVRRLVCLSFLAVHETRPQLSVLGRWLLAPLLRRNVVADHEVEGRVVRDWAIARPPRLTNARRRGTYRSLASASANAAVPRIPRADLAAFMLRQVGEDIYLRQAPGVMS
jgi:NAD(P)H-binding